MNRLPLLILAALLLASTANAGTLPGHTHRLPDHPIPQGVSAPFAGFIDDWLIVGGGCNFPETPAADGGSKVYYEQCYAIHTASDSLTWKQIGSLPQPTAYGCTAETTQGLVCMGGMNADSCLTAVFLIEKKGGDGNFSFRPLPSLPTAIDNASATAVNDCVYITGGNQKDQGKALYRLKLQTGSAWERLPSYPGPQRIQPILVNDGKQIYLTGGYQAPSGSQESILSADMLKFDPGKEEWTYESDIPDEQDGKKRCLAGGAGTHTQNRLIFTGGVNYRIFKNAIEGKAGKDYMRHTPEWYRFNDDILLFDPAEKKWEIRPDINGMARAGGILLYHKNRLYMICGEIKPGIRSPEIIIYPL